MSHLNRISVLEGKGKKQKKENDVHMLEKIKNNIHMLVWAATAVAIVAMSVTGIGALASQAEAEEPACETSWNETRNLDVSDKIMSDEEREALKVQQRAEEERAAQEKAQAEAAAAEEAGKQEESARKANAVQLSLLETEQGSLEENAKKIYSVLRTAGIPDVNIAGVLGNWECESMLDPTSIEGVYGEMYFVGAKKASAIANPSGYAMDLFSFYASNGTVINQAAYVRLNGETWPGIGLGGFTGPAIDPLVSWADSIGKPWYSLEAQVSYAVKGYARAQWLASWTVPCSSPGEAAAEFLHNWEGCYVSYGQRAANAQGWYEKMAGWLPDLEYGKRVLSLG